MMAGLPDGCRCGAPACTQNGLTGGAKRRPGDPFKRDSDLRRSFGPGFGPARQKLKERLVKRTSQVTSPRHPSIAAIRTLLRTVGIGVSRSAVNNPRDRSKSMFFVRNAACTSKIQARRGVGIWSFACLIALAGASLFAFGAP